MSTSTVYDAFKARLMDQLGASYAIRDFEEIERELQQGTEPWIVLEDSGANEELLSVGSPQSNWVTDDGFLDFHVFVPSTGSLEVARSICESVRVAFRFYHFSGLPAGETLRVTETSSPDLGPIADGLWHSMVTTASYTHRYAVATAAE